MTRRTPNATGIFDRDAPTTFMADVKRNSTTTKSDIIDTHCTLRGIIANIDRHLDAAADAYIEKTVGSRLKLLPNNLIDKKFDEPPYNNGNPLDNEDGNPLDKDNGNPYNNGYDNESYDNIDIGSANDDTPTANNATTDMVDRDGYDDGNLSDNDDGNPLDNDNENPLDDNDVLVDDNGPTVKEDDQTGNDAD